MLRFIVATTRRVCDSQIIGWSAVRRTLVDPHESAHLTRRRLTPSDRLSRSRRRRAARLLARSTTPPTRAPLGPQAFDYMKGKGVPLLNIGAEDINNANHKIILALIWALISFFQLNAIALDGISGKKGLLLWCQRLTNPATYKDAGVGVVDFSKSWKDGLAFCAMLHKTDSECLDWEACVAMEPRERLALAFRVATETFDIPNLLDPEDVCDVPKPDEKIVMASLCFFFTEFSRYGREVSAVRSIANACDVTQRHDAWSSEYQEKTAALNGWIEATTSTFSHCEEGKAGHGDTTPAIKATLDALLAHKRGAKPERKAEMQQLGGLLNTLQSSCRNNSRPLYRPPAEIDINEARGGERGGRD